MNHEPSAPAYQEQEITEFEFNSFHRMPSRNHGVLQTRIASLLEVKYGRQYSILTAVDVELPTGKSVPDVSIYPLLTLDWQVDEIKMTVPPITSIEILSPRQAITDLIDKNNIIYFPGGVKSSWIVMPAFKQINVFLPNGEIINFSHGIMTDPHTGIELDMGDVFR